MLGIESNNQFTLSSATCWNVLLLTTDTSLFWKLQVPLSFHLSGYWHNSSVGLKWKERKRLWDHFTVCRAPFAAFTDGHCDSSPTPRVLCVCLRRLDCGSWRRDDNRFVTFNQQIVSRKALKEELFWQRPEAPRGYGSHWEAGCCMKPTCFLQTYLLHLGNLQLCCLRKKNLSASQAQKCRHELPFILFIKCFMCWWL